MKVGQSIEGAGSVRRRRKSCLIGIKKKKAHAVRSCWQLFLAS